MNIIDFIREKVTEGASQSEVARKCGISQALVNKMMHDRYNVQLDTIRKIAKAYNLSAAYFTSDVNSVADPSPPYKPKTPTRQMAEQQLDELSEEELKDLVYYLLGRKRPPFTDGYEPPK
jgi:transcriptional regulator with XRE-family HTH domain